MGWSAVLLCLCVASVQGGGKSSKSVPRSGSDISYIVEAVFNQGGVIGEVTFIQETRGSGVDIAVNLEGLDQFADNYRWSIREFPVRTSLLNNFPCSPSKLGDVFNPNGGQAPFDENLDCSNTSINNCALGDLTSRRNRLRSDRRMQVFESLSIDPELDLYGSQSIVGRSLVIDRQDGPPGAFICANIEQKAKPNGQLRTLRASFNSTNLMGDIIFRFADGRDEVTIEANLYRMDTVNATSAGHSWSLNRGPADDQCEGVGGVYGSFSYDENAFNCDMIRQRQCAIGDLLSKCGPLNFEMGRARLFCTDSQLGTVNFFNLLDPNDPDRSLVVRVGQANNNDAPLGCATLESADPLKARAELRNGLISGTFEFRQNSPDDRTFVKADLRGLTNNNAGPFSLRIFENNCSNPGDVFSRPGGIFSVSNNSMTTSDSCTIGNLDAILPTSTSSIRTTASSSFLPLFGPYSIINRSLALVGGNGDILVCSPIECQGACTLGQHASVLGFQNVNNPPLPDLDH